MISRLLLLLITASIGCTPKPKTVEAEGPKDEEEEVIEAPASIATSVPRPPAKAPKAKPWYSLQNVTYKPQRWDDGDSFHVTLEDGNELILRLYFVDTPEEEKV